MRGLMVVAALVFTSLFAVPYWLLLRPEDWQAVLVNTLWSGFNLILLIAALLVGFEQPQVRAAHRLQRHLRVVISTTNQTFQGTTVNISETGALVSLESLPNLPDEIDVEIMGDSTARVSLTARVVRLSPVSDTKTLLAIDFVNPSRSQIDNLILVSYSDVREWYSQKRQNSDQPFASLGFLATSLTRSFRDIKPTARKQVRKQVSAVGELYWDGHFFSGIATELGVTGLQLEISRKKAKSGERVLGQEDLHKMRSLKPLVGLLLSREEGNPSPSKLLAEISGAKEETNGKIVVDLNFPTQFKQRQSPKIKQLLQVL
jgi:cellulose synthase (UDP-forming)